MHQFYMYMASLPHVDNIVLRKKSALDGFEPSTSAFGVSHTTPNTNRTQALTYICPHFLTWTFIGCVRRDTAVALPAAAWL